MTKSAIATVLALPLLAAGPCVEPALAQAPFGGRSDVSYSQRLWKAMESKGLVGDGAVMSQPYQGQHPHGAVLDTIDSRVKVGRDEGPVIIKRNYGGEGVSASAVADDPDRFLEAVTVMFEREGYDPENQDWFWVKYRPDGSLHENESGMKLAGRIAKGKSKGCIACHASAPGGDMVWKNDRFARASR